MCNNRTAKENFKSFLNSNAGYATLKELKRQSFHSTLVKKMLDTDIIHKIKPGLYRLFDLAETNNFTLEQIDTAKAIPNSIICLLSALDFYDLTTFSSQKISIAIPRDKKISKSIYNYNSVSVYHSVPNIYSLGIKEIDTKYGKIKIYDIEKTICDIFRFRDKLGENIAYESLKNYISNYKNADYFKLRRYAKICRVSKIINTTLKILLG